MAIVRPEQPGDEAEIAAIHIAAFPDSTEADLVERLRGTEHWVPELSIVVQQETQLVAHVLLSRVTAGDAADALALGPVAVLPIHQRGGLGTAMVRMALDRARALGFDCVVAIGIPAFLTACGFRPAAPRGLTIEMDVPDEAFQVAELKPMGVLPGPVLWPDEWEGTGV
ncbi:MAG: N-acetyltransferase [Actinobacteria bacterium]|nr:N-acetyltransferase [Actinomycetota bacterium]